MPATVRSLCHFNNNGSATAIEEVSGGLGWSPIGSPTQSSAPTMKLGAGGAVFNSQTGNYYETTSSWTQSGDWSISFRYKTDNAGGGGVNAIASQGVQGVTGTWALLLISSQIWFVDFGPSPFDVAIDNTSGKYTAAISGNGIFGTISCISGVIRLDIGEIGVDSATTLCASGTWSNAGSVSGKVRFGIQLDASSAPQFGATTCWLDEPLLVDGGGYYSSFPITIPTTEYSLAVPAVDPSVLVPSKLRSHRESTTYDYSAAGWFSYQQAGGGIFDKDLAGVTSSAVSYTLTAAQGSFALTGQTAALRYGRRLVAGAGSFTLTGQPASPKYGRRVVSAVGAFTLTGQNTLFRLGKAVSAAQGVFSLTGYATNFPLTRKLTAAPGAFALTGYAAMLLSARTITAARGTFSLTGNAANLKHGYRVAAGTGAFLLTGQAVAFNGQALIGAGVGSFALAGQAAGLRATRKIAAAAGSFALTGHLANVLRGRYVGAGAGSFALTGQDANIARGYVLSAVAGAYTLTGRAVNITVSGGIDYHAIAMAVWSFVLSNGKTAEETLLENNSMLSALTGPIEGTLTASDLIKVIGAVAAGKTTIDSAAPGTAHVEFAAVDGADIRVAADMTGSERTDVAITL